MCMPSVCSVHHICLSLQICACEIHPMFAFHLITLLLPNSIDKTVSNTFSIRGNVGLVDLLYPTG